MTDAAPPRWSLIFATVRNMGAIRRLDLPAPGWDAVPDIGLIAGGHGSGKSTFLRAVLDAPRRIAAGDGIPAHIRADACELTYRATDIGDVMHYSYADSAPDGEPPRVVLLRHTFEYGVPSAAWALLDQFALPVKQAARIKSSRVDGNVKISRGEQKLLTLLSGLVRLWEPGSMLVIDDDLDTFHISWQARFIDVLRSLQTHGNRGQVLIGTNSGDLFSLLPDARYVIRN